VPSSGAQGIVNHENSEKISGKKLTAKNAKSFAFFAVNVPV
jgi:hypothetical protein